MEEATGKLNHWQQMRMVVTALAALRQQVDAGLEAELARALAQFGHLDEGDRELVRQFGFRMVERMIHHLISRVCQLAEPEPPDAVLDLLLQLFAISPPPGNEMSSAHFSEEPAGMWR